MMCWLTLPLPGVSKLKVKGFIHRLERVKLNALPFFQILVVIEPLLIDEDYYARVEGREIISNLAKVSKISPYKLSLLVVILEAECYNLMHLLSTGAKSF